MLEVGAVGVVGGDGPVLVGGEVGVREWHMEQDLGVSGDGLVWQGCPWGGWAFDCFEGGVAEAGGWTAERCCGEDCEKCDFGPELHLFSGLRGRWR